MGQSAFGRRPTCESCLSIDVRQWHRQGLLRPVGQRFSYSWTRDGKPSGSIDVRTAADAVILTSEGSIERKSIEERVPLVWTKCHFGGARPWFRCSASVGGRPCGRRVAKLYLRDAPVFACRHCCGLVFASQQEIPRHRAISRAQKLRMQLGGGPSLLDPFPGKPSRMHWRTFYKLFNRAAEAQERSIVLALEDLRRRYPEPNRGSMVASPNARPG
jgi:hypothetical protein